MSASPVLAPEEISIVTAFFDIGRDNWTVANGYPPHLHRKTDTYFEYFAHLATLENEMTIYTSDDLVSRVKELRRGKEHITNVIAVPLAQLHNDKREAIRCVQQDPAFLGRINHAEVKNPEYWSPDYVLINSLKSVFAAHAIQANHATRPLVAWLDFGYCRTADTLGSSTQWRYPFAADKIHFFASSADYRHVPLSYIVENNLTFIAGAAIIAGRDLWQPLAQLTHQAMDELLSSNMIDDDQTMLLMATLYKPELFELHIIPKREWQPVLRLFNTEAKTK